MNKQEQKHTDPSSNQQKKAAPASASSVEAVTPPEEEEDKAAREERERRVRDMAAQQEQLFRSLWQRPVFQEVLGVQGWQQIEPVILASLISEGPLLLVGPHGTAKTYFFERLAAALNLEFRFYNTSILNFDDLIGVPVPNADHSALQYISTPSSIWAAEAVFFDEINRTRPELQNKVFPIIHERRVQGVSLDRLRYRWAAMNPVSIEDQMMDTSGYFGAMPLDHALADRFHFIVRIPDWKDLSEKDRRELLTRKAETDPVAGADALRALIGRGRAIYAACDRGDTYVADYLTQVVAMLAEYQDAPVHLSTRRIMILHQNIQVIQAALQALAERCGVPVPENLLNVAGLLALENGLPHAACGTRLDPAVLRKIHLQAWMKVTLERESRFSHLRRIEDPLERAKAALMLARTARHEEIDAALLYFLSRPAWPPRLHGLKAFALYMATRSRLNLSPRVMDAIGEQLTRIMSPQQQIIEASFGKASLMKLREKPEFQNDPFGCVAFNLLIREQKLFMQQDVDELREQGEQMYEQLVAVLQ